MAKAMKLNQPRTRRVSVEAMDEVEAEVKCPWCEHMLSFVFEDENGFEGSDICANCKKEIRWKGEVESVTRCTITVAPVGLLSSGGKLDTFESKDLLSSSEDLEDTRADV